MNRKSIIQEYFILATNEKGKMSAMRSDESKSGIVVAGVMDLLLNDVITIEKKKITVTKDIPNELGYISSLYDYLHTKPRTLDKLMTDYIASTGKRIKQLTEELGESLFADQVVTKGEGGLFGNKTAYIPEKGYKNELIDVIKATVKKDVEVTPKDIALLTILKETKNLNQYFSKYENDELKAKVAEIKRNPQNKMIAEMINYVSTITAAMIACYVAIN